jgi:hypothetical protein
MEDEKPVVRMGQVTLVLMQEIHDTVRELDARRKFCGDVGEWLVERGLAQEFEAWRRKREIAQPAPDVSPS